MSLVRLLTAGKSLVGIQDSKSRYRAVDPRAMPKFGSEKKADVARESEARPGVGKSRAEANVETARNVRAPFADKNVGVTRAVETTSAAAQKLRRDEPVATARKARGSGWVSQWGSKLSSLVSQKPKPTRSAIPQFKGRSATDGAGVPVQGELSLDNIKVVRNDLSDTDLEVVTRKMGPVEKAESATGEWIAEKSVRAEKSERLPELVEVVKS